MRRCTPPRGEARTMQVLDALARLDRRVLRTPDLGTPDGWVRATGRWKFLLGVAAFECALVELQIALLSGGAVFTTLGLLPSVVLFAFQAGMLRSEHARATGTETALGRHRPSGV